MAVKTIYEDPKITDTIQFELTTTDADDCVATPYKITTVIIYFLEKEFSGKNYTEYEKEIIHPDLTAQLVAAQEALCDSPTEANLEAVGRIEREIELAKQVNSVYYKRAVPVKVFGYVDSSGGTEEYPAWLDPDQVPPALEEATIQNNILVPEEDEDREVIPGKYLLYWEPVAQREGDYLICWSWAPNPAGDLFTAHDYFILYSDTRLTTTLPTQQTDPEKYETLTKRYLPDTFKNQKFSDADMTPEVLVEFNNAIAKGFTFLEDQANQILGLIDANVAPETMLHLLSNFFNIKLRSTDPTLWRRQIKESVPLFKKKGTRDGLRIALAQAGMSLEKFTLLWQVISPYTWQEMFDVEEDGQTEFELVKTALTLDVANIEVYFRSITDSTWTELTSDYISITTVGSQSTLTWLGDQLSVNPIILEEGDSIRVIYKVNEISTVSEQTIEDYIRSLDLDDQRDERSQDYPPKNWNVRVIEEDDAMFDIVIPNRHPLHDPLIFGWIRTEFPYSENIYNMEEYNGSTRESGDPCNIDKGFIDPCRDCLGSKYNLEVEIEELANDRVIEVTDILDEFVPFHALLHTITLKGAVNEFIPSPTEDLTMGIHMFGEEIVIAGEAQNIFNRVVPYQDAVSILQRDMLADSTSVYTSVAGGTYNESVVILSPGTGENVKGEHADFGHMGVNTSSIGGTPANNTNWLEILAPHTLAGDYSINNPVGYMADIVAASPAYSEPVNETQFTFRLSNRIISGNPVDITQDDLFTFNDEEDSTDFVELGVKTQRDIDDGYQTGSPWTALLSSSGGGAYDVLDILPDGILVLNDDGSLPTSNTSGLTWLLQDELSTTRASGTSGALSVRRRGLVDFRPGSSAVTTDDMRNFVQIGDYTLYSGSQYEVIGFVDGDTHQFYVDNYTAGTVVGTTAVMYRRLVNDGIAQFGYRGLNLVTSTDYEVDLDIQNGVNPPAIPTENNKFKENYLFKIQTPPDSTGYYAIGEIDGTDVTLLGPHEDWKADSTTSVTFDVIRFDKLGPNIPERTEPTVAGHDFDSIDRRGSSIVENEVAYGMSFAYRILNTKERDNVIDITKQTESVSYKIEYEDGSVEEGDA